MDWDFPGKNTGVGCHFLSPGNLPDPGIKPVSCLHLLHCRRILYCWATREAKIECVFSLIQLFATFMECRLPGSVHGIFQTRILEWVAMPSSMGSSRPKDWTHVSWISCVGRQILCHCTTWEAPYKKIIIILFIFGCLGLCCCMGFPPAVSWVSSIVAVCWLQ